MCVVWVQHTLVHAQISVNTHASQDEAPTSAAISASLNSSSFLFQKVSPAAWSPPWCPNYRFAKRAGTLRQQIQEVRAFDGKIMLLEREDTNVLLNEGVKCVRYMAELPNLKVSAPSSVDWSSLQVFLHVIIVHKQQNSETCLLHVTGIHCANRPLK